MVSFFACSIVLAFYTNFVMANASLTPPPVSVTSDTSSSTSSLSGTTTTNGTLSVTPTSSAQYPSLSGYSDCVTNCLQLSVAQSNCSSVTDVNCYCKTSRFTRSIVNCTETSCIQEISTAESLARQFCLLANASTTLSFPSTTSIPPSSTTSSSSLASSTAPSVATSGAATTTTAANSATTSNAARQTGPISLTSSQFLALAVAIIGALAGAMLVG